MSRTPPQELVLPPDTRTGSLFPDYYGTYPTQTRQAASNDRAGEYRGFYKTDTGSSVELYWRPKSSRFGGRAGGGHGGADIFAPPNTFPHETPVVAVADGTLTMRFDANDPEDLGNRAKLTLDRQFEDYEVAFIYGHLTRFHGPEVERKTTGPYFVRKVQLGDIIGYAGCTGNANAENECTTENGAWRVSSGHVHLIAELTLPKSKTTKGQRHVTRRRVDPVKLLGWDLSFKDADLKRKYNDWKENLRSVKAFDPPLQNARLLGITKRSRRRVSTGRKPRPSRRRRNAYFAGASAAPRMLPSMPKGPGNVR